MIRVFLSEQGEITSIMRGDSAAVQLNTASNARFVDDVEVEVGSCYWDFDTFQFVPLGDAPSQAHIFNYETKEWYDPRTLDELKVIKWQEIKSLRDAYEFGCFEFDGNIYDSDQVSQGRIMGAASAGVDQKWTLTDNTTVELSASQLQQLYAALQARIASVHERGRIARQLIFDAETREQVEAIQL